MEVALTNAKTFLLMVKQCNYQTTQNGLQFMRTQFEKGIWFRFSLARVASAPDLTIKWE